MVQGHSHETMRLYDAMLTGSIPVFSKPLPKFLEIYFPNHPFVILESWEQVSEKLNELRKDEAFILNRQKRLRPYYDNLMKRVDANLTTLVDNSFSLN